MPQTSPTNPALSALSARLQAWAFGLLALGLFALPQTFSVAFQDQFELPKQLLLRALLSLVLGLLLAGWLHGPKPIWRRSSLDLPVLAWCLWALACTALSVSPALSWRGEYENFAGSLTQLSYAALFFAVLQLTPQKDGARRLAGALLGAALGAALYALMQALQRDLVLWSSGSVIQDRFFGPMGNPNFLAGLMAMALPLKLALALDPAAVAKDDDARWRWLALGAWVLAYLASGKAHLLSPLAQRSGADLSSAVILSFWLLSLGAAPLLRRSGHTRSAHWLAQGADLALLFQALANTGTRGAFLGLMAGLACLWLGRMLLQGDGRRWQRALLGLGLTGILLGLAFAGLGSAFRARMAESLRAPGEALERSRLQIWLPALKIFGDHPIAGTGVDTFKTVFPQYSLSRFNAYDGENVSSRNAHSEPLQILATQGSVGLLLWLWLLWASALGWWRSLRQAGEPGQRALLLGLGGLAAAYLGQNLVSFGVAGISAPFWACLGLLATAGTQREKALALPRWGSNSALLAGLALALTGLGLNYSTLTADRNYAFAIQLQSQVKEVADLGLAEARSQAVAAARQTELERDYIHAHAPLKDEAAFWLGALNSLESQAQRDPSRAQELHAGYQRTAASLMLSLAAGRLEDAVARCPGEVKYWVYLGLCYEDLQRWSMPERRTLWFEAARERYARSTRMNPRNAYYHGNLGRLNSARAEAGDPAFFGEAEKGYQSAIALAPSTKLFYENLLVLYARFAKTGAAAELLGALKSREPELAPSLLVAAASTFYQAALEQGPSRAKAQGPTALAAALDWTRQARALKPQDPDYALLQAVFEEASGQRVAAQRSLDEALRLQPGSPGALAFKKEKKL